MSPTGPITRSPSDFNYWKIRQSLDGEFSDIEPYLDPPPCPDGVYHLEQLENTFFVHHVTSTGSTYYILDKGKWTQCSGYTDQAKHLGPFESFETIQSTFPELFI
jgi:hypothetical protein